jgi:hypothetical protein
VRVREDSREAELSFVPQFLYSCRRQRKDSGCKRYFEGIRCAEMAGILSGGHDFVLHIIRHGRY